MRWLLVFVALTLACGGDSPGTRTLDTDGDRLSDEAEELAGTSPTEPDTDQDGANDLVEVALGTDGLDPDDNPAARGNVVFVMPWKKPPEPESDTLDFITHILLADIYFLFDKSAPNQPPIDAMRDAVEMMLGDLGCSELEDPSMRTCVPSIYSGVGQYHDPYNNLVSLQPDHGTTRDTIDTINAEDSISKEDFFEAATCLATGTCGTGCTGPVGCPSFREEAIKMLVMFTDEDSDGGTAEEATAAMLGAGIEFIGIWSNPTDTLRVDMEALALGTGAFRPNGTTPRIFNAQGAGVVPAVDLGIREVIEDAPLRVTIEATDEPGDDEDALAFIDYLQVNTSGVGGCTTVSLTEDTDSDGRGDTFPALRPGTPVCWDLAPSPNDSVEPSDAPQVFEAKLEVRGDSSPLDERSVFFVVPPAIGP